ncbi:flagellar hook-associated protein FlgL [Quadrisphaera sp. DSM 44207]|uniref:flagellar hook-associated protein FlgL n=1 Tax=Quadrisphaera sp. DSM 44207 TaxID=1881057 RepID=UPI0008874ADC|nr:flagellar hook-associated protein FlgL [Quadrisphaera sp. DSM 44207]SDQ20464.1 flagellar hook-associated protein 3 FlgL [Quadrisphaera sp. DSM 44207]
MTRITHRTVQDSTMANLQRNLAAMSGLQEQLSTGKKINRASDDPTGAVSVLQVRSDLRTSEQYSRAADDGVGWLGTIDGALQNTSSRLQRAQELTLRALNSGAMGESSRTAIAAEVRGIKDDLLGQANTKYLGRSVFAGTSGDARAFATAPPYAYADTGAGSDAPVGTGGTVERRVAAEAVVQVDSDGRAVFGQGDGSVFTLLDDIADAVVQKPGSLPLADLLGKLQGRMTAVTDEVSSVGARYGRVQGAKQAADDAVLKLQTSLADVESIDLPKTIVNLQMQEVAYKAALGATAKVLQPSLLDFIR